MESFSYKKLYSLFIRIVFFSDCLLLMYSNCFTIHKAMATGCPGGWNCEDVGSPTIPGSESLSSGVWTISGQGDFWGTSDQGHLDTQTESAGSGMISARVVSQTNPNDWAKAGILIRQDTTAGAAYVAVYVTPSNGIFIQTRTSAGGTTQNGGIVANGSYSLPIYIGLRRLGDVFTAATSSDGVNWTYYYSYSVSFSGSTEWGMLVTSNSGSSSTAVFDNVNITAIDNSCPSNWSCTDIGSPDLAGSQASSSGTLTIYGQGSDLWITDQGHFVYQSMTGDGVLIARVISQQNTGVWAKAGIVFRQDTSVSPVNVSLLVTPENGLVLQYRSQTSGSMSQRTLISSGSLTLPIYLKLTKSGSDFTPATSTDGNNWTSYTPTGNIDFSGSILEGIIMSSFNGSNDWGFGSATFDSISLYTTYSISGIVFSDLNSDSLQNNGETGYSGLGMTLSGDASQSVTTDMQGNYAFGGLLPGSYTVALASIPQGWGGTTATSANITLTTSSTTHNFGIQVTASNDGQTSFPFIASIDTMKESRDTAEFTPLTSVQIAQDVNLSATLNVTHITVDTQYDYDGYMQQWVDAVRATGKHVWFRSNYADWDGGTMLPSTYLSQLQTFITSHPLMFKPGDIFDPLPEPESSSYWNNTYGPTWSWEGAPDAGTDAYNNLLIDLTNTANTAFSQIGVTGITIVHSTNGWMPQSPNALYPSTIVQLGNLVTFDGFPTDDTTDPATAANAVLQQMAAIHTTHPGARVLVGEIGYRGGTDVDDSTQQAVLQAEFNALASLSYLAGTNYWVGAGPSSTQIFSGSIGNWSLRPAADTVAAYFALETSGGTEVSERLFFLLPILLALPVVLYIVTNRQRQRRVLFLLLHGSPQQLLQTFSAPFAPLLRSLMRRVR